MIQISRIELLFFGKHKGVFEGSIIMAKRKTSQKNIISTVFAWIKEHRFLSIAGVVVALALAIVLIFPYELNIRSNISRRKLQSPENMTYYDFFQAIADRYGFHIDKITGASNQIIMLYSNDFDSLLSSEKFAFFGELGNRENTTYELIDKGGKNQGEHLYLLSLYSRGHEYTGSFANTYYGATAYGFSQSVLYKDHQQCYSESNSSSINRGSSDSGKTKCSLCNGTGTVKYYYGSSSLEAYLNGKNDYEFGPCPSCHGTGKR